MESEASIRRLAEIRDDPDTPPMAAVAACNSLLDRAYGRPSISAALAIVDVTGEGSPSDGLSTLLGRVRLHKEIGSQPPAADDKPAIDKAAAAILDAMNSGASKDRLAAVIGDWLKRGPDASTVKPVPALPKPDFVVTSTGEATNTEPKPEPAACPASPKPTPKEWLEEPPAPKRASTRPEPTPPPAKPKHSGAPAGFAAFSEQRQAERERLEKLAASRPGRQLTREEFHTADPVASSVQGAPEHVAFTLAGHGRIKRVAG
jgi:hypothetical protein